MRNLISLLVAVMLIFAVSCNSDNSNPGLNIPEVNTDYSHWTAEEQSELVDDFQKVMVAIYAKEASYLASAAMAEIDEASANGKTEGTITKSNDDKSLTVVADYYWIGNEKFVSIVLNFKEYEYEDYTIWGFSDEYDEYIFKNNTTRDVTKFTVVELEYGDYEYYLNGERVEYISQQIRWS